MQAVLPDPRESRAVLVGVSDYTTLGPIPSIRSTVQELGRCFRDADRWGLPEENCTIIQSPTNATEVVDTLAGQASKVTDTLLFYFAGHGLIDESSGEKLYLALGAASQGRPDINTIPYSWIRYEFLGAARARRKIVILDCCYSGRTIGPLLSDDSVIVPVPLDIYGACILRSTAGTRRALAPEGETYTAFTGEILATIQRGIPGGPELLDLHTLLRYVEKQLSDKERPPPERRGSGDCNAIAISRNVAVQPDSRQQTDSLNPPLPSDKDSTENVRSTEGKARPAGEAHTSSTVTEDSAASRDTVPGQRRPPDDDESEESNLPRPATAMTRGADGIFELSLSMEQSVMGTNTTVIYDRLVDCGACNGIGANDNGLAKCATCNGTGRVTKKMDRRITVPAGIRNGAELDYPGLGDDGSGGGPAGNLRIRFIIHPDIFFSRVADDLHCDVELSFSRATLGTKLKLKTYYGREKVRLEAGTQPGTTVVLVGKGVRSITGNGRGDLFVHLRVSTPRDLNDIHRDILRRFADSHRETCSVDSPSGTAVVPIAAAALGSKVEVATDHGAARLHVPPGVQHDTILRISWRPQDLSLPQEIPVKVTVPTVLTAYERELVRRFGEMRREMHPRPLEPPTGSRLRNALRRFFSY
jgi:DnaJ-class molecular chaperone